MKQGETVKSGKTDKQEKVGKQQNINRQKEKGEIKENAYTVEEALPVLGIERELCKKNRGRTWSCFDWIGFLGYFRSKEFQRKKNGEFLEETFLKWNMMDTG